MFKKTISKPTWYLTNDKSKLGCIKPGQSIVCFPDNFFGLDHVLIYSKGHHVKATRSNINPVDWNHLMRIRASTLGREADQTESFLFNKVSKNLLKNTTNNNHLDEAIRDAEMVDSLISEDEGHVDSCVIS